MVSCVIDTYLSIIYPEDFRPDDLIQLNMLAKALGANQRLHYIGEYQMEAESDILM